MTNEREYFALLTQAYYERSGFFPFTREDLRKYDPVGFELARDAWEFRPGPVPAYLLKSSDPENGCRCL
jgi:hypothetical protein